MKTIVIGVTSSISCFKVVELVRKLKKRFDVEVIMSSNACKLISVKDFEKVLGKKVHVSMFYSNWNYKDYLKREKSEHISLADKAELFLICPATANTIGKIANGISDDLLTTSVMATHAPVLICPAMNCKMWENKIVQENVLKLKRNGYYFVEPEKGKLACGYSGVGRLADIGKVVEVVNGLVGCKDMLKGKKIIVTAGGTSEEIDPVRVITNKSSGKMGIYIAEEAAKMGAKVTLIRGRTSVEPSGKIEDIRINSVAELFDSIKKNIKGNDVIIHAAAVSDFVVDKEKNKIKSIRKKPLILKLKNSVKIIDEIKKIDKKIKLVGFKAEYNVNKKKLVDSSYSLLKQSNAEFVVGNDVSKNVFGSEANNVVIVDKNKEVVNFKGSKREIGREILRLI